MAEPPVTRLPRRKPFLNHTLMNKEIEPVLPKPAAVILLLKDDPDGIKILILRKSPGEHFASGALVFPGGKVAKIDYEFTGNIGENRNEFSIFKIAAIREMYEECGIALACDPKTGHVIDSHTITALQGQHGMLPLLDLAMIAPLSLATDRLVRFAHWITPPNRPRRYDTHFFVANAPALQNHTKIDNYEIVEAKWCKPKDLINDVCGGKLKLVLPTLMNIMQLCNAASVEEAMEIAHSRIIIPVTPVEKKIKGREHMVIPEDADYGITEIPSEFLRTS